MRNTLILLYLSLWCTITLEAQTSSWIRINQLGYLPNDNKVAVFMAADREGSLDFAVHSAADNTIVFSGKGVSANAARWGMVQALRLNFSSLTAKGDYFIECNGARSPRFRIGAEVYQGSADFILKYMRQQRCGYNPYLDAECHQHDGYIVDHPDRTGERIDVRGGWHDASDYLQYLPTSANATLQMLLAWQQTPDKTIFKDEYDALGKKGENGVPDILDEIRWGLDWMVRMNPDSAVMFNQIADDRDHAGMRLPSKDPVDYGWGEGKGRPVYFITGRPQGLGLHINRTTGVASSAGKFASAFALGAELFKEQDPAFATVLKSKAASAYGFAEAVPGTTQTACLRSPYFYEEDNYVDDVELAAAVNYLLTGDAAWLKKADYWGQLEEISPWMELGRARHYQFYPFVNVGHYYLAQSDDKAMRTKYIRFMKNGLEHLAQRAKEQDDPFLNGVPFIWCSNNLIAAAITHARLYHQASGDATFMEMEAALRDWLLGCNPWGTSMICGFPQEADSPTRPHSAYVDLLNDVPYGGLVDGPIYQHIYESLRGIHLKYDDPYAPFQHGAAVYHDDPGDYSSNEPTMDGTASLSFYLSSMEKAGKVQREDNVLRDTYGAIVRKNTDRKVIYLIFSADSSFEGASAVLKTLDAHRIKGSFFLTGNCLRMDRHKGVIKDIIRKGHYVGGHSDKHLLYAPWEHRSQSLVSVDSLLADLRQNNKELERWGISSQQARYYLPPYEWYNSDHVKWITSQGVEVINLTPGPGTAADYTTPDMKNYKSSQELIDRLFAFEKENTLNGCILLFHPGTHPDRTDKFYLRLEEIIRKLKGKGYTFARFTD